MKKIILMVIAMVMTAGIAQAVAADHKKEKKEIVSTEFRVDVSCQECVKKIMNYMPFQKGIEEVKVDLRAQRATVIFDKRKSSNSAIIKAFSKIHIKAAVYVPEPPAPKKR